MDNVQNIFYLVKICHQISAICKHNLVRWSSSSISRLILPIQKKNTKKEKVHYAGAFESNEYLTSVQTYYGPKNISSEMQALLKEYKFLKNKRQKSDALYILHHDLADLIIENLDKESFRKQSFIFEINPGPGILTKKLLEAGYNRIKAFEAKSEFISHLKELQKQYSKRLTIEHLDFLTLPKKLYSDYYFGTDYEKQIFEKVIPTSWCEDPPLTIIGVLPPASELNFLRYLIAQLAWMKSIYSYGRTELFVFLSGKEIEEPRNSFYPLQKACSVKKAFPADFQYMYLVKIIPKKDLFSLGLSVTHLKELLYFLRHLLHRRSWSLVQQLTKWMPESEIYKLGYNKMTKTGDLTPEEYLKLFKHLIKQPNYNTCGFHEAIDHNLVSDTDDKNYSSSFQFIPNF